MSLILPTDDERKELSKRIALTIYKIKKFPTIVEKYTNRKIDINMVITNLYFLYIVINILRNK